MAVNDGDDGATALLAVEDVLQEGSANGLASNSGVKVESTFDVKHVAVHSRVHVELAAGHERPVRHDHGNRHALHRPRVAGSGATLFQGDDQCVCRESCHDVHLEGARGGPGLVEHITKDSSVQESRAS